MNEPIRRPTRHVDARVERSSLESELEYDGAETPVLIRLPDLTAAENAVSVAGEAAGDEQEAAAAAQRQRRRRVHRSHNWGKAPEPVTRVLAQAELRPKLLLAAGLLTVIGATYAVLHGGGSADPQPPADRWVSADPAGPGVPSPTSSHPAGAPGNLVQLWPGEGRVTEEAAVPEASAPGLRPASGGQIGRTTAAPPELSAQWPAAPQLHPPAMQPPAETPVSWPDPAAAARGGPGWPEAAETDTHPAAGTHHVQQPGGTHPGWFDQGTLAPAGGIYSQARAASNVHNDSGPAPATARLNGNIEIPRPASTHEQSISRIY
jgi:hypothetical protein